MLKTITAAELEDVLEAAATETMHRGGFTEPDLIDSLPEIRGARIKNVLAFMRAKSLIKQVDTTTFAAVPAVLIGWGLKQADAKEKAQALKWLREVVADPLVRGSLWIPIDPEGSTQGGFSSPLAGFKPLEKNKRCADGTPYLRHTLKRSGGGKNKVRPAVDIVIPKIIGSKVMRDWEKAQVLVNPATRQLALKRGKAMDGFSIRWDGSPHYLQVSMHSKTALDAAADLGLEMKDTTIKTPLSLVEEGADYLIFAIT